MDKLKKKGINVLSLFDGISCGQLALQRAGIKVDKYYSSEIDKYAISITQHNFPNTIQLGDVRNLCISTLNKKIDLLIGGSPCQDLSTLGKREGLAGKKSSLFYEYYRILQEFKPKYFLLENNANMPKTEKEKITELLGVTPIQINSILFTRQNRNRLYWTNIPVDTKKLLKLDYCYTLDDLEKEEISLVPYVQDKIKRLKDKYGYIPTMFNPYNIQEIKDIHPCLTAQGNSQTKSSTVIIFNSKDNKYYKFTSNAWEILQTLPIGYTLFGEGENNIIPKTQRYKCIGNGWTVDVIAYILRFINDGLPYNDSNRGKKEIAKSLI